MRSLDVIRLAVLALLLSGNSLAQTPPDNAPDDPFLTKHRELADKNPEKLSVTLQLKNSQTQFHPGEIIPLELAFSSTLIDTYVIDNAGYDRSGRLNLDDFVVDRPDAAVDPLHDYYPGGNFGLGGLRTIGALDKTPKAINYELNEWLQFRQPGKYRLYVIAGRITKGKPHHSGNTPVAPVSNIVEFEILPRDEKWEQQKLADAVKLVDSSPKPMGDTNTPRHVGCRALRFLDTETSIKEIIRRFRGEDQTCDFEYDFGLLGTGHREFAVTQMEAAIYDRDQPISESFLYALTFLASIRDNPAPLSPYPLNDAAAQKIWQAEAAARRTAADSIKQKYIAQLAIAVKQKQGSAAATSLATLADLQTRDAEIDEATRNDFATSLAKVFFDLPVEKQRALIEYQWRMIAGPAMLPVLRQLYEHPPDLHEIPQPFPGIALRRIYELAPEEGRQLILDEMRQPKLRVGISELDLLPDKELPQLEAAIVARAIERRDETSVALIPRYVSAASLPGLRVAFENRIGRMACLQQADLISYFLRVAPDFGLEMIKKAIRSRRDTRCYPSVLTDAAGESISPELETLVLSYLSDTDPEVVFSAVQVLCKEGSIGNRTRIKDAITRIIDGWREAKVDPEARTVGDDGYYPGYFAESFLRAYALAIPWVTTADELSELAALCLTEQCRKQLKSRDLLANTGIRLFYLEGARPKRTFALGEYETMSWTALKRKAIQYPPGTKFIWHTETRSKQLDQQAFDELKSYLQEKGFELVRYEPPKNAQ